MPKEYDSVISEELADISKGLRKRHRTGVSGTASAEMMQLRNRTDELAEAFGSGNETNREKKIKEAYKASLNYEMMKRQEHEEYDWQPDSDMGKERIRSARQLRQLLSEYFPELAQQAISEFREEKKNHKYASAANAVSDYASADADNGRLASVSEQRAKLNAKRKIVRDSEIFVNDKKKALESRQKEFEDAKKIQADTECSSRLAQIKNGLNKLHSGSVAGLPSSEMRKLRKAERSLEKALKKSDGNVNDPAVVRKMKAAYKASLNYELARRKDDASGEWHPSTEMGRDRMAAARDIRKLVAEDHPEIAEEANKEFLEKYVGKSDFASAQAVADYTDKTIKVNKERLQKENIRERAELARKQAQLDRDLAAEAKKEHDLKKADRLNEIDKGLNAVHRGKVAGTASSEMKALREANSELNVALRSAEGNVNDLAVVEAMYKAYKASLNYETLKRKNDMSPDFRPSTRMGAERLEASRRLREFVIEHCPDMAQKAARDHVFERRGKDYGKTAEAVAKSDQDSIDLYLLKQQTDLKNADLELDIRAEEMRRRNNDLGLQKNDLELQQMQEEARRQKVLDDQQRMAQSKKISESLYAKRKGFMTGTASDEMKALRQAKYKMDHAVDVADGDLTDPRAEAAMIAAYKASMKYELYKRQNDAGASWTPSTDMGKKRMEASREIREYVASKRPDLAEKAGNDFLEDYKFHKYNKALSTVVNYTKPLIAAAKKEKENEPEKSVQADFEARRELIARQRIKIEAGIMTCERIRAQISGTENNLAPEKRQEFAKQQEELDKQKMALLRRQGELELRPDAEVPEIRPQIANEAAVQRNEPEPERQNDQLRAGKARPGQEKPVIEGVRNAENIRDLENAVIVNNEVVEPERAVERNEVKALGNNNELGDLDHVIIVDDETGAVIEEIGGPQQEVAAEDFEIIENEPERAGERNEAKAPGNNNELGDLDHVIIVDDETGEVIEEIGGPQQEVAAEDFEIIENKPENEPVKDNEEVDLEKADPKDIENRIDNLDDDKFSVFSEDVGKNEPQNDKNELGEDDFEIIENKSEKAPVNVGQNDDDFIIEEAEPEILPMRQVRAQPVIEKENLPEEKQPEKKAEKAEPPKKAPAQNAEKPKTPEQQRYEDLLATEKESIGHKLIVFDSDRENGIKIDREAYKKTVAEAMAVEKLESMYKENGRMFEKTFETQKELYAGFVSKNAQFDRFTSMREPGQILGRMMNNMSLSAEMEEERYKPSLNLNGFISQYKDKDFKDMSRIEFNEMVQDSKTVMCEDIRRSAGKVPEEEMNRKLARFATFNAISPTDPKTGKLRENGTINRLRNMRIDLDDVLGQDGLSDSINNPEFKALLNKYGTEKLTEMALDGDGQKLSSELIQAGVRQKADEKTYAKQREAVTEMNRQPKPEMNKVK